MMPKKIKKYKKKIISIVISEKPAFITFGRYFLDLGFLIDELNKKDIASIINNEVVENFKSDDIAIFSLKAKKIKFVKPSVDLYKDLLQVFKKHIKVD